MKFTHFWAVILCSVLMCFPHTASAAPATVTLDALAQTYNGAPRIAIATTNPAGLAVNITYDGSANAPTNAGSYAVVATVNDANYTGSASGTLVVAKATLTLELGGLAAAYDGNPHAAWVVQKGIVTTLTGKAVTGSADGLGGAAQFNRPESIAFGSGGMLYLADSANHTIRKIAPNGTVTTFAGTAGQKGAVDGLTEARFNSPVGIVADSLGNLFVTDSTNCAIRKISPSGVVTIFAGTGSSGSADGVGTAASFRFPRGIAIDSSNNLYVADSGSHTIRKITPARVVSTLAGSPGLPGSTNDTGSTARFNNPMGLAVDNAGNVYVADGNNYTIRKITPAGVVTTFAGSPGTAGSADGASGDARFMNPRSIALDSTGDLYVGDGGSVRRITGDGTVTTLPGSSTAGERAVDGTDPVARFGSVVALAFDASGNLFFTESGTHALRKRTAGAVITTVAGAAGAGTADGTLSAARFLGPVGLSFDTTGNLYVADMGANTLRRVGVNGMVSTPAGLAENSGTADGVGSTARFSGPRGVLAGPGGVVYVVDANGCRIRRVSPGGVVNTLAGSAFAAAFADGTGTAAKFNYPAAVAGFGSGGSFFVFDLNNTAIRQVTPAGQVTTVAGVPGSLGSSNGPGATAQFSNAQGMAMDPAGNLYVADSGSRTIRKVAPDFTVSTIAGLANAPSNLLDGPADGARFASPSAVVADAAGNVFVADGVDHVIRKISAAGIVTTIAGARGVTGSSDGAGSAARFNLPLGLAMDTAGNVYVSDTLNATIRKITGTTGTINVTYDGSSAVPTAGGSYAVVATLTDPNCQGSVSGTLTIAVVPAIQAQPQGQTITVGTPLVLSVGATGGGLTYQWRKGGVNIGGAIGSSYSIDRTIGTDAGSYDVVITNIAGSVTSQAAVIGVTNTTGVVAIAAGGFHSLFIKGDGSLWGMGLNVTGGLSQANPFFCVRPSPIATGVVAVAAGSTHTLYLLADGSLWGLGNNGSSGSFGPGMDRGNPKQIATGVSAIAAAGTQSLFLKQDGTLWGLGDNNYGQLGPNATAPFQNDPVQIASGVARVATGEFSHTTAFIKEDGSLWMMGDNFYGQLGTGNTTNQLLPVQVASGVLEVSVANTHTLFVKSDHTLWGMGAAFAVRAGSSTTNLLVPTQVAMDAVAVYVGNTSSYWMTSDRKLWAMGTNSQGQFGDGSAASSVFRAPFERGSDFAAVANGGLQFTLFLKTNGALLASGINSEGELGDGSLTGRTTAFEVVAGSPVIPATPGALAVANNGSASSLRLTWSHIIGATSYEIWRSTSNDSATATRLAATLPVNFYTDATAVVGTTYYYWLKAANHFGLSTFSPAQSGTVPLPVVAPAITAQPALLGTLLGASATFTVGASGTPAPTYQWQRLAASGGGWTNVSNGGVFSGTTTTTLTITGATLAMNWDQYRCVATNSGGSATSNAATLTVVVPGLGIVNFAAGRDHSAWVNLGSNSFVTGDNSAGQLGVEGNTTGTTAPFVLLIQSGYPTITNLASWSRHMLVRDSLGGVWGVGLNDRGQLGTSTDTKRPVLLASGVGAFAAGVAHSAMVSGDGKLRTMGGNDKGQLGNGTMTDSNVAIQVATNVIGVAAGSNQTLFRKDDNSLWGMGDLYGTGTLQTTPVALATGVRDMAAGNAHSAFVKADGTLWTLGDNAYGQLGNNSTVTATTPVEVATDVVAVGAGYFHTLFVKTDGTLWAMGYNADGQLGDGTTTNRTTPVQVSTHVVAVKASLGYTLFTRTDGTLWAMGSNASGQFGNGTTTGSLTPIQIAEIPKAPVLTLTVEDRAVVAGGGTSFLIAYYGTPLPTVQWQRLPAGSGTWANVANGGVYSGAQSFILNITGASLGLSGDQFRAVVTNPIGSVTSNVATLTVAASAAAPVITGHPATRSVAVGSRVTFTASASGVPTPTYQWQRLPAGSSTWVNASDSGGYSGVTFKTLTVIAATLPMSGEQFRCVVTNSAGSVTSKPAALTVGGSTANEQFVAHLFRRTLQRNPNGSELAATSAALGSGLTKPLALDDLLALPEYQNRKIETVIRLYYAALRRGPDYAGLMYWSERLRTGVVTPAQAGAGFAGSAEFTNTYGSLNNTQFIELMYRNVLGREVESAGLNYWLNQMNAGTTRGEVLVGFSDAPEFVKRMYEQVEVIRLHVLLYGRVPTATELANSLGFLHGEELTEIFLDSPEFAALYPSGLTNAQYVNAMFQGFMRRGVDSAGLNYFTNQLSSGATTRARLLNTLVESIEFKNTVAPVARMYFACLQRPADPAGLNYWTNYVRSGNTLQAFADGIASSPEFQTRYGSLNDTQYIQKIYLDVLGRAADSTGLAYWQNRLGTGADTRASMLLGFANATETTNRFATRVITHLHYLTFLNNRQASAGEFTFWNNYLLTLEYQLREDLLGSSEFYLP